ncbi:hypothetical protein Tco_0368451 [Tanacetum coccineum]
MVAENIKEKPLQKLQACNCNTACYTTKATTTKTSQQTKPAPLTTKKPSKRFLETTSRQREEGEGDDADLPGTSYQAQLGSSLYILGRAPVGMSNESGIHETDTAAPKDDKDQGEVDSSTVTSGVTYSSYPKVHENLKLITDERVIDDKPESHSGSMSSMKNLDDTFNFGDQFLHDKPIKDDQEKSKS